MTNSRKQIIAQLQVIEKKLKRQQREVTLHKNYFLTTINNNLITLLATLLPSFLWGWKQARVRGKSKIMKQLVRYGLLAVATNVKKQIVSK